MIDKMEVKLEEWTEEEREERLSFVINFLIHKVKEIKEKAREPG